MLASIFYYLLRLFGWKLQSRNLPDYPKAVFIFAHHTSNWDFITMICTKFVWRLKVRFLGKHTLFNPFLGWFFRSLGGIPVERSQKQNLVEQVCDVMEVEDRAILVLAPEGTRSPKQYWKTGFYHIAHRLNIPIVMFYLHRPSKYIGFSEGFLPTGDIEADFKHFAAFYADKEGFIPSNKSLVQTKQSYLEDSNKGE